MSLESPSDDENHQETLKVVAEAIKEEEQVEKLVEQL